jgi:hypothetical protein
MTSPPYSRSTVKSTSSCWPPPIGSESQLVATSPSIANAGGWPACALVAETRGISQ